MNKRPFKILLLLICFCPVMLLAADYIERIKLGNEAYNENDYQAAIEHYRVAETEKPETPELNYNLAGALYQQGKYEEAVEEFSKAMNTTNLNQEAAAHYNLGNTYFKMADYQNAIKSYQSSLEINPDDMDAKYNLELARKMLKEQMKPEDQQQDEQEKKEQEKQEQQQQDQQQDEQDKKDSENEQQKNEQEQKEQEQKSEAQPQDEKKMSKEDAERILNALKDDEQETQKKVKRNIRGGNYSGKDW